jgi:hypothetical protein
MEVIIVQLPITSGQHAYDLGIKKNHILFTKTNNKGPLFASRATSNV